MSKEQDRTEYIGAASSMREVSHYHDNRLNQLISRINSALNTNFLLTTENVHADPELYGYCKAIAKAETHAHLKVSVDFEKMFFRFAKAFFRDGFALNESNIEILKSADLYLKSGWDKEGRNLKGFSLVNIFSTFGEILSEINDSVAGTYTDIGELISVARKNLTDSNISTNERRLLEIKLKIFEKVKNTIKDMFNFKAGGLPQFVEYYQAASWVLDMTDVSDEMPSLQKLTKGAMHGYMQDNVEYAELRFNIGRDVDSTLEKIATIIQAVKGFKTNVDEKKKTAPEVRLILSSLKFDNRDWDYQSRVDQKTQSIDVLLAILRDALKHPDKEIILSRTKGAKVTYRDVLKAVVGLDAAGQEEGSTPDLFFDAYHKLKQYNSEVMELSDD